jgi:hypothetical protein
MSGHPHSNEIDLRSPDVRERVARIRTTARSYRVSAAILLLGAGSAILGETARLDAANARDEAERVLETVVHRYLLRGRLEREIALLHADLRSVELADRDLPTTAVLAAIADALPREAVAERIALVDEGGVLRGTVDLVGAPASARTLAESLASMRPFAEIAFRPPDDGGRGTVEFTLPVDRAFVLVTDASTPVEDDHEEP